MSSFIKKGNRSNKIRLFKESSKDIKNYGKIQKDMEDVGKLVSTFYLLRKFEIIPSKEVISGAIDIACEELNINLRRRYKILLIPEIINNLAAYGLHNPHKNESKSVIA